MVRPRYSAVQIENVFYLPGLVMDRMIVEIIRMNEVKYVSFFFKKIVYTEM